MINIAICDDEKAICGVIENIILSYSEKMNIKVKTEVFHSGEKLLKFINDGNIYDLIFLDIEMDNLDGIEFGKILRNENDDDNTKIVYISWKEKYAMELFRIRPYDFLIKPLDEKKDEIEEIIQKINDTMIKENQYFVYQVGKTYNKELYSNISYFSSSNRVVNIHTKKNVTTFYSKLDAVEEEVDKNLFLRIHKSLLINVRHANRFERKQVIMDTDEVLEISKTYREAVNTFILEHWGI